VSNGNKIYTLVIKKKRVEVSEEIYKAYYKLREREKYIEKLNRKYTISLDRITEEGYQVERNGFDIIKDSAEDQAIKNISIGEIKQSLNKLEPDELIFIKDIFEKGFTEKEIAHRLGITQQAVNHRKMTIFKKLRNSLKDFR